MPMRKNNYVIILLLSFIISGLFNVTGKEPDTVVQFKRNYKPDYSDNTDSLIDKEHYEKKLAQMGEAFFIRNYYDSALIYFNHLIKINVEAGDSLNLGKAYNSVGNIYFVKNKLKKALEVFKSAQLISKEQGDPYSLGIAYSNIAITYLSNKDFKAANLYFDSSMSVARQYQFNDILLSTYYQKSKALKSAKENTQSGVYNLLFNELQDSILSGKDTSKASQALLFNQQQENKLLRLEKNQQRRKTLLIILFSTFIIVLISSASIIYISQLRQKNKLEAELARLQKQQFQAVLEAQERERKRIASDLHDSVGQMLSLTKLNMSDLMDNIADFDSQYSQEVRKSIEIIDEACQEIREISHNLMPGSLIRLGFVAATKDLIRKLNHKDKLKIDFRIVNLDERLGEKIEVALYRILQEILNNALKHSQANKIYIVLSKEDNMVELSIRDNGIGFNPDIITKSKGIGWKNIYSRLAVINGTMEVKSRIGQGVHIKIEVPV